MYRACKRYFLYIASMLLYIHSIQAAVIINQPLGGRLGENLYSLGIARYLSQKYAIPLCLQDFEYLQDLPVATQHDYYPAARFKAYRRVMLHKESDIHRYRNQPTTMIFVSFHTQLNAPMDTMGDTMLLHAPTYKEMIRCLLPQTPMKTTSKSIAVHVRTGGDFDSEKQKKKQPLKFPPLSWYCDASRKLLEELDDDSASITIFTDDLNTEEITHYFQINLDIAPHRITCYSSPEMPPLIDLLAMSAYQYLIRPHSYFSIIAEALGSFKRVITPYSDYH